MRRFCVACCAVLFTGCSVPGVYPLYTPADRVFEPELLGTWQTFDEAKDWDAFRTLTFARLGAEDGVPAYRLGVAETPDAAPEFFEAHLVRLGNHLFLDIVPADIDLKSEFAGYHLMRLHTYYLYEREGRALRLTPLSPAWVQEQAEAGSLGVDYVRDADNDDRVVLTANTPDLQVFVRRTLRSLEAWPAEEVPLYVRTALEPLAGEEVAAPGEAAAAAAEREFDSPGGNG